jgi:lysine 2,3-aminomutase
MAVEQLTRSAEAEWGNWRWQQRSAIRTTEELLEVFPGLAGDRLEAIDRHTQTMRFQVTRHFLGLVEQTPEGAPRPDDPLWRQVMPADPEEAAPSSYSYDGTENWELPSEMVTPIAQHKYDDRVIVRAANVCHAYCQFCYEALRTLEKESDKPAFNLHHWDATLGYLLKHPEIQEVILSGGEPLMQSDEQLGRLLGDLRALPRPLAIRIHTRALAFNPFRITEDLCATLAEHGVTAVGLHATHVHELGPDFVAAAQRLQRAVPVLFANIPLLRGVNDSAAAIHELSMKLYMNGVARGYLYHFMPHSPGSERFRTNVSAGVEIIRALKRRVSNLAVPEFVLPHHTGKYTMPLLAPDEQPPQRATSASGEEVLRFRNWQDETIEYPDPALTG